MRFYIRFWYKKLKLKTMKITNTKKILIENFLIYGMYGEGQYYIRCMYIRSTP